MTTMHEVYQDVCKDLGAVMRNHSGDPIAALLAGVGSTLTKLILVLDAADRDQVLDDIVQAVRLTVSEYGMPGTHYDA